MITIIHDCWNKGSIGFKMLLALGLSIAVGQFVIIARQAVEEGRWRHDSALEVNRVLTTLMANQAGRSIENGDEADLEAVYFDVAYGDESAEARSEIAALFAYNVDLQRVKSYVSLEHLGLDEVPLRDLAADAIEAREMVRADYDGLLAYAVPVYTQRDRILVGALTVAWDTQAVDAQTREALTVHAGLSIITAIGVLGLLLLLVRKTVVAPLAILTQRVLELKRTDYIQRAFANEQASRGDEIGTLFLEFDNMVMQLADARRRLLEQSYHAGVAESVSGILHNLRNTLHPVATAAWNLRRVARPPQMAHLRSALDELASNNTPEERRGKLVDYVQKSLEGTGECYTSMCKDIEVISAQILQAEHILESFGLSKLAATQLTAVNVQEVVENAARVVRQKPAAEEITIEIDDSIKHAPAVYGQEVILIQLLGNLFVNAYEAIAAAEVIQDGRIQVKASCEEDGGRAMVILEVRDNGQGIEPTHLQRVFERGFSTRSKKGGSGIGLHWCANSVLAMGGRLVAASDGAGTGATFYVHLLAATNAALAEEEPA